MQTPVPPPTFGSSGAQRPNDRDWRLTKVEVALVLFVLAIPLTALVGGILGITALLRVRRLERRLAELEATGATRPAPEVAQPVAPEPAAPEPEGVAIRETVAPAPPPVPATPPPGPEPPVAAPPEPPSSPREPAHPPAAQPPSRPRRPRVEWERWIGIRGAALAGGIVLALASLLFFQYSIEHGLISPATRVVLGIVAGLTALFGSEWLRRKGQPAAANALAGAGVVILYAAVWAARVLYELVAAPPAWALMVLVTIACGLLAHRRRSLLIAMLGLFGGFATPLLLATGADRPIGLFSYVLLLDAGLLWLARKRRWSVLAVVGLAATAFYEGLWILLRMDAPRAGIGLGVLAVFAVLYVVLARPTSDDDRWWKLARTGAVIIPSLFALHFGARADLGEHLAPVGALLLLLGAASWWLARSGEGELLLYGSSGAILGTVALFFLRHQATSSSAAEAVAVCSVLALAFALAAELESDPQRGGRIAHAFALTGCGLLLILVFAGASGPTDLWPWLAGWVWLAALLARAAGTSGRPPLHLAAALGPALGFLLFAAGDGRAWRDPDGPLLLALMLAVAVGLQLVALATDGERRRWAERSAVAGALALLAPLAVEQQGDPTTLALAGGAALGLLAVLAATRAGSGLAYLAAVVATACAHLAWTGVAHRGGAAPPLAALAIEGATVIVLTFWPTLSGAAFAGARGAWYGAALAAPLWFLSLRELYLRQLGGETIGALAVGLALLTLGAVARARRVIPASAVRTSALAWLFAVSLCFVSLAIPLQLDREWITIGWALNGVAVLALWRRLDHPGLKYFGLGLLGAAAARLVANPSVLGYYPRSGLPVLNWLAYTYLVPALALLGGARLLGPFEGPRLLEWERRLYGRATRLGSAACGLAAVAVVFVWINLAIADLFATGEQLALSLERMPARDLATSVAWALYAVALLAIGIARHSSALRWLSLGLMLATIAKVFLHDLGQLEDLYRVASLLGLAISLILVSLAYQRFVFRANSKEEQ